MTNFERILKISLHLPKLHQKSSTLFFLRHSVESFNKLLKRLHTRFRSTCVTGIPVKNWKVLLQQTFTAYKALLTETSALVHRRRRHSS